MIINGYKKIKNNKYELTLNNNTSIILFEETIIKYNLLIYRNISQTELELIIKENNKLGAYYIAINYLNKKMRTEFEVKKYLKNKEYNKKIIDNTIAMLKKQGYIDDDKYIDIYINDQFSLTNNGPEKIKYNLIKLGIDKSKIHINKDFNLKIKKIIDKKVALNNKLSTKALIINISHYLIRLGYNIEIFQDYLEKINNSDDKFIKIDYKKLYNKYKNKYDQNNLNLFIKDNLYKKGYDLDLINKTIEKE
ncbi:MAG: RecX family transcriptional regulator [Bacilli bacterium]|nr:RecX family transcriptional regulator [Bacilli bacterium]MDD4407146.1 RecX family transcriptional regulator [Bacilli bacterium]